MIGASMKQETFTYIEHSEIKKNENRVYAMFACANLYSLANSRAKAIRNLIRVYCAYFHKII